MIQILPLQPDDPRWDDFLGLPLSLAPQGETWGLPVSSTTHKELSLEHPFRSHGRVQPFLALQNGHPVGRIVASVDDNLAEGPGIGHFGYLETIDDEEVACALFQSAEAWLRQCGVDRVMGPVNLTIYIGYRLQISGFEHTPFHGEPRNPAYYRKLVERCGYQPKGVWRTWDMDRSGLKMLERHMAAQLVALRGKLPDDFTIQHLELDDVAQLETIYHLTMAAFATNWGYSPISLEEFSSAFEGTSSTGMIFKMALNADGEPVGFCCGFLDSSPPLQPAEPAESQSARGCISAVAFIPEAQKTLAPYLSMHAGIQCKLDFPCDQFIITLVKPGRRTYIEDLGEATRSYAVFEKHLS